MKVLWRQKEKLEVKWGERFVMGKDAATSAEVSQVLADSAPKLAEFG